MGKPTTSTTAISKSQFPRMKMLMKAIRQHNLPGEKWSTRNFLSASTREIKYMRINIKR
jgi:hypothetical protein